MSLAVEVEPATRWQRLRAPLVTIGSLSAATLALHLRDPHHSYSWGVCPLSVAGIYCPGCGGLRAVNDLTNGNVGAAASSNLLAVIGIPIAIVALLAWTIRGWRGVPQRQMPERLRRLLWMSGAVIALGFTVARNTPAGAWLAP
ncbi:DUF2752 domain-containing protein [Nocardioides sp.]|uniref:DUF2752 domain-containing protein n=1 Tax=Nocardioides sp. TaxID=35761 RepID=UPI0039E596B5